MKRKLFYAGVMLATGVVFWLTNEPLLALVVLYVLWHAPYAFARLGLEYAAAQWLARRRPGCVKCERLPQNPTRATQLARPVRTPMRYRYVTNSFHCPDCGAEEYWADVLRRHGAAVPETCSSLADLIIANEGVIP